MPGVHKNNDIGFEVKSLSRQIGRTLKKELDFCGITGVQAMIIGFIASSEEDVFQRDIENAFEVRRSTVTGILNGMESGGLIERQSVEHDARLKKLVLTQKATELNSRVEQHISKLEARMEGALTPDELKCFFDYINRIKAAL